MAHPETEAGVSSSPSDADVPGDLHARLVDAIAGDDRFDDDEIEGDEAPDEDAPEADDAEGQDAEQEGEPEEPAIAPPVSWKAEHKDAFAALPPELQQVVAEREAERERFVQSKAQEAANARQAAWNEARAAAEQQLANIAAQLEQQVQRFTASPLPDAPDVALIDTDPQEFLRQKALYDNAIAQRQEAQQQAAYLRQMQEQAAQQARQQQAAQDFAVLAEKLPGWADDAKRPELAKTITDFAVAHGFAERLEGADATDILFLHEAMGWKDKASKWDAYQQTKMQAVRAAKELPKIAKPNAAQPPGSAKVAGIKQARETLAQTGSVKDAARLIANFL